MLKFLQGIALLFVRNIREKSNLSLNEMSERMGMSRAGYTYLERTGQAVNCTQLTRLKRLSRLPLEKFWMLIELEAEREEASAVSPDRKTDHPKRNRRRK